MKLAAAFVTLTVLWSFSAWSYYDEFVIGSSADYFTLKKQDDGNFYVGDEKVRLGSFNDFIYLFGTEIAGACPKLKGKPDITIIARKTGSDAMGEARVSESKRQFYLNEKMVKGDKGCAPITGDGIYYLPMHKYWFTGESKLSLAKAKSVKIEKDGALLAHARLVGKQWEAEDKSDGLNFDFFNNFINSLNDFPVFARLHPAISKGKPNFTMTLNGQTYQAYYVAKNLWAMKFPKSPWLVASQNWSVWEDMRGELWKDRHYDLIKVFSDRGIEQERRYASLQDLGTKWSPSIKKALQKIIKNPSEPLDLRLLSLQYLKQRPSLDNFGAMIHALKITDNREFQEALTKTLRVRNPKGPVITVNSDDDAEAKAIREWVQWWNKVGE